MGEAGKLLEGVHDFRNLCKMDVGNGVVNFKRRIDKVTVSLLKEDCLAKELVPPSMSQNTSTELLSNAEVSLTRSIENYINDSGTSVNANQLDGDCLEEDNSIFPDQTPSKEFLCENQAMKSTGKCHPQISSNELNSRIETTDNSGYEMCVVTVKSKAFLWHQVRAMMAVLLLVGEGNEDPSVITELMDVETNPRKPQYSLASELPLCLFTAEYPESMVQWRYSAEALHRVNTDLQHMWAQHAIR